MGLKDFVSFPLKVTFRITLGIVGFLLMGVGLLLMSPLDVLWAGIPLFVVGLLLLVKSVF